MQSWLTGLHHRKEAFCGHEKYPSPKPPRHLAEVLLPGCPKVYAERICPPGSERTLKGVTEDYFQRTQKGLVRRILKKRTVSKDSRKDSERTLFK